MIGFCGRYWYEYDITAACDILLVVRGSFADKCYRKYWQFVFRLIKKFNYWGVKFEFCCINGGCKRECCWIINSLKECTRSCKYRILERPLIWGKVMYKRNVHIAGCKQGVAVITRRLAMIANRKPYCFSVWIWPAFKSLPSICCRSLVYFGLRIAPWTSITELYFFLS
jgi:hypothetical protein